MTHAGVHFHHQPDYRETLKMKRHQQALAAVVTTAAAIVAPPNVSAADTYVSIGSCPIGCTAYTWSAGIADVINRNVSGVQATAEETKGYVANIKLLQKGELEASFATSLSSYQAYKAIGNYAGTTPGKILSWMSIKPTAMHVITLEGSGIGKLAERREILARWDPPALKQQILESQRRRRFVQQVLLTGDRSPWDYQPAPDASKQYVRSSITTSTTLTKGLARYPYMEPVPPDFPREERGQEPAPQEMSRGTTRLALP